MNGRTVRDVHLYVNGVPLDESKVRHRPVTPMTDSSLVRLADVQSNGKTGTVPHGVVEQGSTTVRAALADLQARGFRYAAVDVSTDSA